MTDEAQEKITHTGGVYIEGDVYTTGGDFVAGDKHIHLIQDPVAQRERRSQRLLLEKVRQFWINGVLDSSLQPLGWMEVRQEARPDLVAHPWEEIIAQADSLPQEVDGDIETGPAAAGLLSRYDTYGQALLILGDPGTGKTTALLALARELAERAGADDQQPIPVVLNLATWGTRRSDLDDWVVDELNSKYQIPREIGRRWLEHNDLTLLLDGLDEVNPSFRRACMVEINQFRQEHGLTGVAVCCRLEEYQRAGLPLQLGGAVLLKRMPPEQAREIMSQAGEPFAAVRNLLDHDPQLQELAQTPLMLSILAVTFQGSPAPPGFMPGENPEQSRTRLLDAYISQMFHRRGRAASPEQVLPVLSFLARRMGENHQAIFLIEGLQPGWLSKPASRMVYGLLTRLVFGILSGLLFIALNYSLIRGYSLSWPGVFQIGLLPGIIGGLAAGLIYAWQIQCSSKQPAGQPTDPAPSKKGNRAAAFLKSYVSPFINLTSLAVGISASVVTMASRPWSSTGLPPGELGQTVTILFLPFVYLAAFTLIYGFSFSNYGEPPHAEIDPVEAIQWSWRSAVKGLLAGTGLSILISLSLTLLANLTVFILGLSRDFSPLQVILGSVLIIGLVLPVVGIPIAGIFFLLWGIQGKRVETAARPNQGILQSLRNAGFSFLITGLAGGALIAVHRLAVALVFDPLTGANPLDNPLSYLVILLAFGLFLGTVNGLRSGGMAAIQHLALRLLLWREKSLPWQMTRALEQGVDLALLHRVGNGYLFIHRVFQEHFADLDHSPGE